MKATSTTREELKSVFGVVVSSLGLILVSNTVLINNCTTKYQDTKIRVSKIHVMNLLKRAVLWLYLSWKNPFSYLYTETGWGGMRVQLGRACWLACKPPAERSTFFFRSMLIHCSLLKVLHPRQPRQRGVVDRKKRRRKHKEAEAWVYK